MHEVKVEADEIIRDETPHIQSFASAIAQIIVTPCNVGILRGRARNFHFAPTAVLTEDPLPQQMIGRIAREAFLVELGILAIADRLDEVAAGRERGADEARLTGLSHEASLAAAKTKIIIDEFAWRSVAALFDVGGASAATLRKKLDRHWRNTHTLSSSNPASNKALALGTFELQGTPLPGFGFF